MQITNTPTNIPFKAPAELDGQNPMQNRQDLQQTDSRTTTPTGGDTLTISPEAQALNSARTQAYDSTVTPRNRTQVMARTNAADVADNRSDNAARLQEMERQTVRMNQPAPPAAPPEADSPPEAAAPTPTRANQSAAPTTNTGETTATGATTATGGAERMERPAPAEPGIVAPRDMATMRRAVQENPVSVAGGLTQGYSINRLV